MPDQPAIYGTRTFQGPGGSGEGGENQWRVSATSYVLTLRKSGFWVVWAEGEPSPFDSSDASWGITSIWQVGGSSGPWVVAVNADSYYGNNYVVQPSTPGWVRLARNTCTHTPMLAHYMGIAYGAVEGGAVPDDTGGYGTWRSDTNVYVEDLE